MVGQYWGCLNMSARAQKPIHILVIGLLLFLVVISSIVGADDSEDIQLIVYSSQNASGGYNPIPPDVPLPANVTCSLRSPLLGFVVVETKPNQTEYITNELLNLPWVEAVEYDVRRSSGSVTIDETIVNGTSEQWAMRRIGIDALHRSDQNTSASKVGVISTGVDTSHPEISSVIRGYDWVDQDSKPLDTNGYGTALCGVISCIAENMSRNETNVSVLLIPERIGITGDDLFASRSALAIAHATDVGADIILMGYGGSEPTLAEDRAIAYAKDHGVLMIAPAGDNDSNAMHYPSDHFDVISVSSIAKTDGLSYFSNYGIYTELVAPGEDIILPCLNGSYCRGKGTGIAAAEVAGVAALLKSRYPSLRAEEIRSVLQSSAIDLGRTGRDIYYGYGLLNAPAALKASDEYTLQKALTAFHSGNESNEIRRSLEEAHSAAYELHLACGWNFVSVPAPLMSQKTCRNLFSKVNTDGHSIWTYDDHGWTPHNPDASLEPMQGVLIYSDSQASVPLVLNINSTPKKVLRKGWNLVGSPYLYEAQASVLFPSLNSSWVSILPFNISTQQYDPAIINGATGTFSDSRNISPFTAFWIYMEKNGTFIRSS